MVADGLREIFDGIVILIEAHICDGTVVIILIVITTLCGRRFDDVCASVYFLLRSISSIYASADLPIVGSSAWYRISRDY
jgi:hypothetical protein